VVPWSTERRWAFSSAASAKGTAREVDTAVAVVALRIWSAPPSSKSQQSCRLWDVVHQKFHMSMADFSVGSKGADMRRSWPKGTPPKKRRCCRHSLFNFVLNVDREGCMESTDGRKRHVERAREGSYNPTFAGSMKGSDVCNHKIESLSDLLLACPARPLPVRVALVGIVSASDHAPLVLWRRSLVDS